LPGFGVIAGQSAGLGDMMIEGIKNLAPTGVMLLFAILFFSIMTDTGLFDPLVARLIRIVHGDPMLILIGSVVLCALVSLDGDGSTTYIITIAALLPLYGSWPPSGSASPKASYPRTIASITFAPLSDCFMAS